MVKVFYGSELKICITIDPIDNMSAMEFDFSVRFYCKTKSVTLKKNQLILLDADNYIACLDTKDLDKGLLYAEVTAKIPDNDFPKGYRLEVNVCNTNVKIE